LICTCDSLSGIVDLTAAKHDTTSLIDAFDFSMFLIRSLKTATNYYKCLNVLNRVRSENFRKIVSKQQIQSILVDGHEV